MAAWLRIFWEERRSGPTIFAGWYVDEVTGGTKYWDGGRWTGDYRPPRRTFASPAKNWKAALICLSVGLFLLAIGVGLLLEESEGGVPSFITFLLLNLFITMPLSVFFLRGRGPTTTSVEDRVAEHREDAIALSMQAAKIRRRSKAAPLAMFSFSRPVFTGTQPRKTTSWPAAPSPQVTYPPAGYPPSPPYPSRPVNSDPYSYPPPYPGTAMLGEILPPDPDHAAASATQVKALAHPQTAKALENLQNLLYTRVLTPQEFEAAKRKLIGSQPDAFANLARLIELHQAGVLSEVEFVAAKARLLDI